MKCCTSNKMIDTLTYNPQPENWLYEIRQKGHDSTCYVMVPHATVGFRHFTISFIFFLFSCEFLANFSDYCWYSILGIYCVVAQLIFLRVMRINDFLCERWMKSDTLAMWFEWNVCKQKCVVSFFGRGCAAVKWKIPSCKNFHPEDEGNTATCRTHAHTHSYVCAFALCTLIMRKANTLVSFRKQ